MSQNKNKMLAVGMGIVVAVLSAILVLGIVRPPDWGVSDEKGVEGTGLLWLESLEEAMAVSEQRGMDILVDFSASWCIWCRKMEKETFLDPATQKPLAEFILLRVDVDKAPDVARRFQVRGLPTLMVLDAEGRVKAQSSGFLSSQDLLTFLRKPS